MSLHTNAVADVKADLYATIPGDGTVITLLGDTTRGDILPVDYMYDANSSVSDNYPEVIKPTLQSGNGRFLKKLFQQYQSDWAETDAGIPSYIQNKPVIPDSPDEASITPSLNTPTQASDTARNATINVSISISVTSTLLGTNLGNVFFEISADGSTNWLLRAQIGNSVSGVVSTIVNTHFISGFLPAGYYYRLRTAVSGANGATFNVLAGQEILL